MTEQFTFAERVQRVSPSATLAISNKASKLEAEGVDVVDLSAGEPNFDTPGNIKDAAEEALEAGETGYTPSPGIPRLREAIAEKLHADGLDQYGPENVMVTPGGKQALFEVFQTLVEDGDEVVLLDPAWVLLVINSPGNPHGAVYSDAALDGVRDLAVEHDVTVISDEIYKEITYDDVEMTSLGTLDGMGDRSVTVNGFSKAYAMTGWRLGYFAGPESLLDQAGKVHGHSVSCATNFVQHAGVEALENTDEAVAEMAAAFEERRDMLVDAFHDRGVDVVEPKGAFYMMLPVADDDQAWCEEAISDAHVATVPGSAFGTPGYARISYANSTERLREAVDRLEKHALL
ncbi:MAG: aspartate aminotransferase [Halobacteriales archaeon SW_8_66_22]|nr:MAG: aspartate aminotransferase [Halobacteriales archaeon SW_8_66_22]